MNESVMSLARGQRLTPGMLFGLLSVFGPPLLLPNVSSAQTSGDDSSGSCLRLVRNLLGGNVGNWGQAGAPVAFPAGGAVSSFTGVGPASFTLQGSTAGYSLLGVQLSFTQNTTYALRVMVSNYSGNYPGRNFEILGASPNDFSGVTHLNFGGNGVYALVFTYLGQDALYLARVGINVDGGASRATGPGGFTVTDLSLERLSSASAPPSEYVTPGYAWGFNSPLENTYDSTTGMLFESAGRPCPNTYRNVWAVTADSFGDNTYSFPNQLANNLAMGYVFFVDSVPGRKLATAQANIDALLSNASVVQTDALLPTITSLPSTVAKPNGLIVEGGVDDIVLGSTAAQLEAVAASIISNIRSRNLTAILMTVSPFGNNRNWTSEREQVRLAYNQWLRGQAAAQKGDYVYDMAASAAAGGLADNNNSALLASSFDSGDGLHPNLAGGDQIAQRLAQILDTVGVPVSASATGITAGKRSTLTAMPAGLGPFTYQWYQGTSGNASKPIAGATGASYTTPALDATTDYWVQVTSAGGARVDSATIAITVAGGGSGGSENSSDGPLPLWAMGALGAGLVGIASRRFKKTVRSRV